MTDRDEAMAAIARGEHVELPSRNERCSPENALESIRRLREAVNGDDPTFSFGENDPFEDVKVLLAEYDRLGLAQDPDRIAKLQYEAGMYQSMYENLKSGIAPSQDQEPMAWQMRVAGANGSWFEWENIDQDEYALYQRSPQNNVEVRPLYVAPVTLTSHRPEPPKTPDGMEWRLKQGITEIREHLLEKEPRLGDAIYTCDALLSNYKEGSFASPHRCEDYMTRPEQQILKFLAHWTSEPVTIRQGRMPDQYQVSIAGRPGLVRVSPDGDVQWIYGEM